MKKPLSLLEEKSHFAVLSSQPVCKVFKPRNECLRLGHKTKVGVVVTGTLGAADTSGGYYF